MQKLVITFILSILCLSIQGLSQNAQDDFRADVDKYIKSRLVKYDIVRQSYWELGNDFILDTKSKPVWKRATTLKGKTTFKNRYNQTVYPRFFMSFYYYKDTTECDNARAELLKCMGGDCIQVKWGASGSSVKSSPFIYIFNPKEIIVCHIYCEHVNGDWDFIKKELKKTFGSHKSKIMELLGCGAPLNFQN